VTQYSDQGESGVVVPVIDFVARFAERFHHFRSVSLFADPALPSGQPEF
jgi:hemerythrin-like domain-containing protein